MTAPAARPSPFLPVAVAGHLLLALVWLLGGPRRVSSPSFAVPVMVGRWLPGADMRPMLLWALLSAASGLVLAGGWVRHSRPLRLLGWCVGASVLAFIAICYIASAFLDRQASLSAPVYVGVFIVGAHWAAASREAP